MDNICFVTNPIVIMNAKSAINYLGSKTQNTHLVISTYQRENLKTLFKYINVSEWKSVDYIYFEDNKDMEYYLTNDKAKLSSFRHIKAYSKLSRKYKGPYKYFFNAFLRHYPINAFANKISYQEYVHLDEGNMVHFDARMRNEATRWNLHKYINFKQKNFKEILLFHLLNVYSRFNLYPIPKVTFYSIFKLDLPIQDKLINIDYSNLKNGRIYEVDPNLIFFLGAPQVERGNISLETYELLLQKVTDKNSDKKLIYYSHRYEKEDKLNYLKQKYGFEIILNEQPIEFYFLAMDTLPAIIYSTYSSAISNLFSLFGSTLCFHCFRLSYSDLLNKKMVEPINAIYKKMEEYTSATFIIESI